jgi:16S rRNA (guanine527-N7)-methyltransferase
MSSIDGRLFAARLIEDARELDIPLSDAQAAKLADYVGLLAKWNGVYNLTAIRDPEQMRVQHVLDSLSILPHLDARNVRSVIDVGTGGGLPGVVIAIMRPDWHVTLNDIVHKKTAFLTQAKGSLGLNNVAIHTGRVEEIRVEKNESERAMGGGAEGSTTGTSTGFDAVVSRAFADLADFVTLARHLVSVHGAMFAMKGQKSDDEIARLPEGAHLESIVPLTVPRLNASRHLLTVTFQGNH